MSRKGTVAILVVVALFTAGCCEKVKKKLAKCEDNLETCETELASIEPATVVPAFKFEIEDSYGIFLPLNNQFEIDDVLLHPPYRAGYLIQIGDFEDSSHTWNQIKLYDSSGNNFKTYDRDSGLKAWIDIVCGTTSPDPITPQIAKRLGPEWDDFDNTKDRKLHMDLKTYNPPHESNPRILPVSLWSSDAGMVVKSTISTDAGGTSAEHGHAKFSLQSTDACEVRVWDSLSDAAPAATFPDTAAGNPAVARILVFEVGRNTSHGGPHQPIWP